jgi:hypothetical protein
MMREVGSGAKAPEFLGAATARLKSCPFTKAIARLNSLLKKSLRHPQMKGPWLKPRRVEGLYSGG